MWADIHALEFAKFCTEHDGAAAITEQDARGCMVAHRRSWIECGRMLKTEANAWVHSTVKCAKKE